MRAAQAERVARGGVAAAAHVQCRRCTHAAHASGAIRRPPTGPRNCHDVTAYPAMHLLAGACASYGLLVDISNPEKPVRLDAKADTNFSLWHTAVFSNDGSKVVFTDEWGGGTSPNCQATSMMEMGGNTILTISTDKKLTQHAYFKIPTAQTAQENCVSHNGGLIPVPGRDIMVQGWYQGGVDVSDFTDPDHPFEVAFFDRGPVDPPPAPGDTASAATSRIARHDRRLVGRVLLERLHLLVRARARLRHSRAAAERQAVGQRDRGGEARADSTSTIRRASRTIVWPAAFPVVRSYLDQLVRDNGLSTRSHDGDRARRSTPPSSRPAPRARVADEARVAGRRATRRVPLTPSA